MKTIWRTLISWLQAEKEKGGVAQWPDWEASLLSAVKINNDLRSWRKLMTGFNMAAQKAAAEERAADKSAWLTQCMYDMREKWRLNSGLSLSALSLFSALIRRMAPRQISKNERKYRRKQTAASAWMQAGGEKSMKNGGGRKWRIKRIMKSEA